jgi:hypothetical protein
VEIVKIQDLAVAAEDIMKPKKKKKIQDLVAEQRRRNKCCPFGCFKPDMRIVGGMGGMPPEPIPGK